MTPDPRPSTLFPYTTLFRSSTALDAHGRRALRPFGLASRACRHPRSEEHTSELQSRENLVCRLLLEKKKKPERHVYEPQNRADVLVRAILASYDRVDRRLRG